MVVNEHNIKSTSDDASETSDEPSSGDSDDDEFTISPTFIKNFLIICGYG